MKVRDHNIYKVTREATFDVRDFDGDKIGERRGEWTSLVVAETEDIARAWAMSGSRKFTGADPVLKSVELVGKLDAMIETHTY